MVDGLVSVSRRETEVKSTNFQKRQKKYKYTLDNKIDNMNITKHTEKLSKYDTHLKKFEHTKALNVVLAPYVVNKTPEITVAVLKELLYRRVLHAAVGGFESKTMIPLLRFINKNIGDQRFTKVLVETLNVFLGNFLNEFSFFSITLTVLCLSYLLQFLF